MKTNYEISIIYNDLFKNESLTQAISNLEKLDQITNDIFNRINKSLMDKKTKLENLKSRINRANQIISNFENMSQALTLKSKRFYPVNGAIHSNSTDSADFNSEGISNSRTKSTLPPYNYQSIYFEDVCDFSLIKVPSIKYHQDINTKPSNPSSKLGKKPDGMLDDVNLYQDIINTIQPYKEISSDQIFSANTPLMKSTKQETPLELEKMNSLFQFMDKAKIYGEKKSIHHEKRESKILNNFMKKKAESANIKKPQEAPVSITEKVKLTKYTQKKDLIRRNTNTNIQLNIPKNLNLPLISDFDVETTPIEDYFGEDNEAEVYAPQGTIFNDDINEFQTPLDIIKNYNKKQSQLFSADIFGAVNKTEGSNNINSNSNTNTNINPPNSSTSNQQNIPNNYNNASSNEKNINNNPSIPQNLTSTQANNTNNNTQIPQKQNVPSIRINTTNNIPNPIPSVPISQPNNNGPKIPLPPKIPVPPPIIKAPTLPNNIPIPNKAQPVVESKAAQPKSFQEEIVCENPMARLKKIGTINVDNKKEDVKDDKKQPAARQPSMVRNIIIQFFTL